MIIKTKNDYKKSTCVTKVSTETQSYDFSEKLFRYNERSLGFNFAHKMIVFGW